MALKLPGSLIFFLVFLPLFLVGAVIGIKNSDEVTFSYLLGEIRMPLIALLIGEFILVVALTLAASYIRIFGLKAEIRRMRKQLRDSETELRNLRALSAPPQAPAPLIAQHKVP